MFDRLVPAGPAREWFVALTCFSLLLAPWGCRVQLGGLEGADVPAPPGSDGPGLFINDDLASPIVAAARGRDGSACFLFGTRGPQGELEEVESILVRTADGRESFVALESGRPIHVQGPDGSYAHVTYSEVSPQRLRAVVELYDAATGDRSFHDVEIDLQQTAQQVAELVERVTGRPLKTATLADLEGSGTGGPRDKEDGRRVRITIISPLFAAVVVPVVALVALTTVVLGQMVVAIYVAVAAALQAVVLAVFAPLFVIGELLSEGLARIELTPLRLVFQVLPARPVIILR